MARDASIHRFLNSKEWRQLRLKLIAERGNKCQSCNLYIPRGEDITGHHIKPLTPDNVGDANISLNPENINLICSDCHDKEHERFKYARPARKEVYIVYGPPLSGKNTYVAQNMRRGDLIVDIDRLSHAISGMPEYDKPDNLYPIVSGLHNQLLDNIKTRYGKWDTAWVITGGAERYKRERLAKDLGAELIFCDVDKQECLRRLAVDIGRQERRLEWKGYINKWFDRYGE